MSRQFAADDYNSIRKRMDELQNKPDIPQQKAETTPLPGKRHKGAELAAALGCEWVYHNNPSVQHPGQILGCYFDAEWQCEKVGRCLKKYS